MTTPTQKYLLIADEIRAARPEVDRFLIAEWCLDILPLSSYKYREYIRKAITDHLKEA